MAFWAAQKLHGATYVADAAKRGAAAVEMAFVLPVLVTFIWIFAQLAQVYRASAGIQQALGNDALAHFRSSLLAALGNTHTRQAAVLLNDYLLVASRQVERDDVTAALARVGAPATQFLVEQSAKTSDPDLLASYAEALAPQAKTRSDALVQLLLPGVEAGLDQPGDPDARRASARRIAVLMRFTGKADYLAKLALAHHDREVVEPVLIALAKSGGREVLPELQQLEGQADQWLKPEFRSTSAQIRWRLFGPAN